LIFEEWNPKNKEYTQRKLIKKVKKATRNFKKEK
jgi:hypothetical protein